MITMKKKKSDKLWWVETLCVPFQVLYLSEWEWLSRDRVFIKVQRLPLNLSLETLWPFFGWSFFSHYFLSFFLPILSVSLFIHIYGHQYSGRSDQICGLVLRFANRFLLFLLYVKRRLILLVFSSWSFMFNYTEFYELQQTFYSSFLGGWFHIYFFLLHGCFFFFWFICVNKYVGLLWEE